MKKLIALSVLLASCVSVQESSTIYDPEESIVETMEEKEMKFMIDTTEVTVAWEDNASVDALQELVNDSPLAIHMSMYGGFEQVGSIGTSLPRKDVQTTTASGDIVLYSGDQIVVFYGSNSWAYTRLGHIQDKTEEEMRDLLSHGDVDITILYE